MKKEYEIIKFSESEVELDVKTDKETMWLSLNEICLLFDRDKSVVSRHLKNIFNEGELNENQVVAKNATTAQDGKTYIVAYYNLDVIISVGYRVKSKQGIIFRQWANKVLKQYLLEGYAYNEKRLFALNRTIEIQNKMLSSSLNIDHQSLVDVINEYTNALDLLDSYDHQTLIKPQGNKASYKLSYDDSIKIINSMKFKESSNVFGVEKENGKLNGILEAVHLNVF